MSLVWFEKGATSTSAPCFFFGIMVMCKIEVRQSGLISWENQNKTGQSKARDGWWERSRGDETGDETGGGKNGD